MPICAVHGCSNRSYRKSMKQEDVEKEKKISFHLFPKNELRRLAWFRALGMRAPLPSNAVVCSVHFAESDFNKTLNNIRLKDDAIPKDISTDKSSFDEEMENNEAGADISIKTEADEMIDIEENNVITNLEETADEDANNQFPTVLECSLFGEYIARELQQLPRAVVFELQSGIHKMVMESRLEYVRRKSSEEAPPIVKQEIFEETDQIDAAVLKDPLRENNKKRPRETDPLNPNKYLKRNNHDDTMDQPNIQTKVIDKFTEHIKEQLTKLPESDYVQLQTEINAIVMNARTMDFEKKRSTVWIKEEVCDEDQAGLIDRDEFYLNE